MTKASGPLNPLKVGLALTFQFTLFLVLGALLWHWSGRAIADFVRVDTRAVLQGLLLGGAMIGTAWGLFRRFPRQCEQLVRLQAETYAFFGKRVGWPLIILVSIGAGVGEEALFRGGVQTLVSDEVGPAGGIVIAAALFAGAHFGKPLIMALIFLIGALFGVVYAVTGSLLTVMIAHAVYDVFALKYLFAEMRRLELT